MKKRDVGMAKHFSKKYGNKGQRGFLFSHSRVLSSILSLSFLCSSVSEALFTLSFSFLSERFFFVHDKAALARSRNQ